MLEQRFESTTRSQKAIKVDEEEEEEGETIERRRGNCRRRVLAVEGRI